MKVQIADLKDGQTKKIQEDIPSNFLEISEDDLKFQEDIQIDGKAYLANNYLIINISIKTTYHMICSICNNLKPFNLNIKNIYYSKELENIKNGIYDFTKDLRESIILEIPNVAECNEKNCPERGNIEKYLKKGDARFPFKEFK